MNRECEERLIMTILSRMAMKVLLPNPLHTAVTWYKAASHIKKGLSALLHGKVDVALLDATAITVSLLRNDHDTASSIMSSPPEPAVTGMAVLPRQRWAVPD